MCALSARGRTFSRRPDVTLEDGLQTVVCFFEDFLEIPYVRHFPAIRKPTPLEVEGSERNGADATG